jgi:hypothetical protein
MPQKCARPAGGGPDRAAFDDLLGGSVGASIIEIRGLRQEAQRRLRRQRAVARVHRLGVRVTFELFEDLARRHPEIAGEIDDLLDRFGGLDPGILAVLGGDRFALPPTRLVGDNR